MRYVRRELKVSKPRYSRKIFRVMKKSVLFNIIPLDTNTLPLITVQAKNIIGKAPPMVTKKCFDSFLEFIVHFIGIFHTKETYL